MSLVEKRSLYDRHQLGALGNTIGSPTDQPGVYNSGNPPKEGNYFADGGAKLRSTPFQEHPGTSESSTLQDHMLSLLQDKIESKNSAQVYDPSVLDLNGGTDDHSGATFFDGNTAPFGTYGTTLKQFGGPYKTTGPSDGRY